MGHEEARAFGIAERRLKAGATYRMARDLAIEYALASYLACDSAEVLRAVGGRTVLARAAVERAIATVRERELSADLDRAASAMWPETAATLLRRDCAAEVQLVAYQREISARVDRTRG